MTDKKFSRVIIQNEQQQFLVVVHANGQCNFPGGKIEAGESAQHAAIRETFEEANIIVDNLNLICKDNFPLGNDIWDGNFFTASIYKGKIKNMEPEKLLEVGFKDESWVRDNGSTMFVANILDRLQQTKKTSKHLK